MNEAEIGAIALLATALNEIEEKKKAAAQATDVGRRERARADTSERRAQEAERRTAALTAERDQVLRALDSARRWARAWRRAAKQRRARYLTELQHHELTAAQLTEAAVELAQCRKTSEWLPNAAIDAFVEYREKNRYSVTRAKQRALRTVSPRSTR